MEIEICKYLGKSQQPESKYYSILSYDAVVQNSSLLLINEGEMADEDDVKSDFFEIVKVQFIASCKTEFKEEGTLLVAFYLGEGGELCPYLLSSLSGDYYQGVGKFILVDYKSYTEICGYTGETKLSLADYLKEIRTGTLGSNALLSIQGQLLNYTQQKEHYKTLDKLKTAEI